MATISPSRPPVFNVPNQLTSARLVLAVVLVSLITFEAWIWCIVVFSVAAFTDWLDGYLARKQGLATTLGRVFDPLVDKVLISGAFIFLLAMPEKSGLSAWMVTVVVARELIITGMRSFVENLGISFGADWLGKIKMGLQCASLFAIFIPLSLSGYPGTDSYLPSLWKLRNVLLYTMVAATALSGIQYVCRALVIMHREKSL